MKEEDLILEREITWCPGCGNFAFLAALRKALVRTGREAREIVVVWDIGCAGNGGGFLKVSGVTALHGRTIPVAVGIKRANPELLVIAQGGDGGILNEGANHLIHAAQRNDKITVLLNNNFVFGLTTGQATAGTPKGLRTRSTPEGSPYEPLSAVDLAVTGGAKWVARVPVWEIEKAAEVIYQAICFSGFSLVELVQPCVIWAREVGELKGVWVEKPFEDYRQILGKRDLWGVLYRKPKV